MLVIGFDNFLEVCGYSDDTDKKKILMMTGKGVKIQSISDDQKGCEDG